MYKKKKNYINLATVYIFSPLECEEISNNYSWVNVIFSKIKRKRDLYN